MFPAASESVWRIELPATPQELQIKPFTLEHYNTLKIRYKKKATALAVQRKTAARPAQHCHCCTWKRREELEVAVERVGESEVCSSGLVESMEKLDDNIMVDAAARRAVGSASSSILATSALIAPAGKSASNARAAQQPKQRRVRLTLKVKSAPSKPSGARAKTRRPQGKDRDREPVVVLPVKISSRGRLQRPLQRHRNDLY